MTTSEVPNPFIFELVLYVRESNSGRLISGVVSFPKHAQSVMGTLVSYCPSTPWKDREAAIQMLRDQCGAIARNCYVP